MKTVTVLVYISLALASASLLDEDETAVLNSPFHQHAADFLSQFQSYMHNKPAGSPKEVLNTVFKQIQEARKALSAQRPTGTPHASHKERADFNNAQWLLNHHYQKARSQLRKWNRQYILNAIKSPKPSAVRGLVGKRAVIGSPFQLHAAKFRGDFDDIFGGRPTGRPLVRADLLKRFKEYMNLIGTTFAQAKANMGKPSKDKKKAYKNSYKNLVDYRTDAKQRVKAWKHKVEKQLKQQRKEQKHITDADETEVLNDKTYLWHAKDFFKQFQKKFSARPTGGSSMSSQELFKLITNKYTEARKSMLALKPTGKLTEEQDKSILQGFQRLVKYRNQALQRVKSWIQSQA